MEDTHYQFPYTEHNKRMTSLHTQNTLINNNPNYYITSDGILNQIKHNGRSCGIPYAVNENGFDYTYPDGICYQAINVKIVDVFNKVKRKCRDSCSKIFGGN